MRRVRHLGMREAQGCDVAYDFSRPSTLFDATSGGALVAANGAIARCEDASGNHMTQATATARPIRKVAFLNGQDVAQFDGTDDVLSAGDVADMRLSNVDVIVVFQRTGGSPSLMGVFGKSRAAAGAGRWSVLLEGREEMLVSNSALGGSVARASTAPLSTQVLHGSFSRVAGVNASSVTLRRNSSQVATTSLTANVADENTADQLLLGAYQGASGAPSFAGSFFNGLIAEAAKWSATLPAPVRNRLEQSRARKWGVAT